MTDDNRNIQRGEEIIRDHVEHASDFLTIGPTSPGNFPNDDTSNRTILQTVIRGLQRLSDNELVGHSVDGFNLMTYDHPVEASGVHYHHQMDLILQLFPLLPSLGRFHWGCDHDAVGPLTVHAVFHALVNNCPSLYDLHLEDEGFSGVNLLDENLLVLMHRVGYLHLESTDMDFSDSDAFDGFLRCIQSHPTGFVELHLEYLELSVQQQGRLVESLIANTNHTKTLETFALKSFHVDLPALTTLLEQCSSQLEKLEAGGRASLGNWGARELQAFGSTAARKLETLELCWCTGEQMLQITQAMAETQPCHLRELKLCGKLLRPLEPLLSSIKKLDLSELEFLSPSGHVERPLTKSELAAFHQITSLNAIFWVDMFSSDQQKLSQFTNRNQNIHHASNLLTDNLSNASIWVSALAQLTTSSIFSPDDGEDITAVFLFLRGQPDHIH